MRSALHFLRRGRKPATADVSARVVGKSGGMGERRVDNELNDGVWRTTAL